MLEFLVQSESTGAEPQVFQVRQEGFEGTLGELAWGLRRGTVAPAAIDLLELVKSYLDYFEELSARNLELASAALPNVAQIVELKLRLLLPRPPREAEEEEEEELEQTLEAIVLLEELEDAIDFLRQRRNERRIVLPARAPRPEYKRPARPISTGIGELAKMASRYRPNAYFELAAERLTMSAAMKSLLGHLKRWGRSLLRDAPEKRDWMHLTVYFAGMLELVREGKLHAHQEEPFGEIELELAQVESAEVA